MLRTTLLAFFFLLVAPCSFIMAQSQYSPDLKSGRSNWTKERYKPWSFFIAPGLNYTATWPKPYTLKLIDTPDTTFHPTIDDKGKIGYYFEAGAARDFKRSRFFGNFQYMDFGAHYKYFQGEENLSGDIVNPVDTSVIGTLAGQGIFKEGYVGAFINFNNVYSLGKYNYIQHSWGLNAEYRLQKNIQYDNAFVPHATRYPGTILGQLHYKFSYGLRATKRIVLTWSLETPLVNVYPFKGKRFTLGYFNSRYQPFILSMRIQLLRKFNQNDCPEEFYEDDLQDTKEKGLRKF